MGERYSIHFKAPAWMREIFQLEIERIEAQFPGMVVSQAQVMRSLIVLGAQIRGYPLPPELGGRV